MLCLDARMRLSPGLTLKMLFSAWFFAISAQALTLQEIESTPNLTPQRFARFFSGFEFRFHAEIQSTETFLASESGDCDDYAILAARVLKAKGFTPHLIAVRMPKLVHVVCYIEETKSYLDYNRRSDPSRMVASRGEIAEIAGSVAKSYGAKWTSASEFSFESGVKRLVQTILGHEKQIAALSR
jgi:hypothetical protein